LPLPTTVSWRYEQEVESMIDLEAGHIASTSFADYDVRMSAVLDDLAGGVDDRS
jgi:hypothetical protein